jgi:hypothetical protein
MWIVRLQRRMIMDPFLLGYLPRRYRSRKSACGFVRGIRGLGGDAQILQEGSDEDNAFMDVQRASLSKDDRIVYRMLGGGLRLAHVLSAPTEGGLTVCDEGGDVFQIDLSQVEGIR